MMDVASFSNTYINIYQSSWRHVPENSIFHRHLHESLKSYDLFYTAEKFMSLGYGLENRENGVRFQEERNLFPSDQTDFLEQINAGGVFPGCTRAGE
jgi:hypothetical protein